ncbi:conserved hypothetical protein [Pirellula staleyi DSM 6068]|uniref:Uncharacterized protein n=1 Tax=Pirellula staleyi (strain ATCC 27377 / DSM 6068 / ICPB 4128) TaxID=530564 RepID=D2R7J1_PIRSD|nr:conserved hypothetical protein [Pirellula staleyi DSM 6068]
MSLRPQQDVHKSLISTTSRLVGEYETDCALLSHAWPDFRDRSAFIRREEGPASRSAFIFAFRTVVSEERMGPVPNYNPVGEMICSYLAVLYGKRFDSHGQIEGSGYFRLPDLSEFGHLCRSDLSFNSHKVRVDYSVPLNLVEFSRIERLLKAGAIDIKFLRSFQTICKFYLQSLQTAEHDPEVAYLHLITAIEVLSNFFEFEKDELLDDRTLNALSEIESGLTDGKQIAALFRSRMLQVKRRFLKSVLRLVDDDFFTRSEATEPLFALKLDSFESCMGAAYDLRSRYVHTGVPFGSWVSRGIGGPNTEVQVGAPVVDEDRELGKLIGRAPTFAGLERVTRYVILRLAESQGVYVAPPST